MPATPAAPAVESATATTDRAASVEASTAITPPGISSACIATLISAVVAASDISARGIAIAVSARVVAPVIAAVIPRAGANEQAAGKPIRTVIAVRSASIRIVSVIAVSTHWWAIRNRRAIGTNTYSNRNLCMRVRRWHQQN